MDSGEVSFNLPIKSYLKKYLIKKYGTTYVVHKNSWLGGYLVELMDKQYRKTPSKISEKEYYHIVIPQSIVARHGFDISTAKIKRLNDMIEKIFLSDLYSYINVSIDSGLFFHNNKHKSYHKQKINRAIQQFLSSHGIFENEKEPDSLYRNYLRDQKTDKDEETETIKVA